MNELAGKEFRYLIGTDVPGIGATTTVTVVGYDVNKPVAQGISVAYCNLFDEKNSGQYSPYLHTSDTASQYNEGQIDPKGKGWKKNLTEQFTRRQKQGFKYIELDNPDAYDIVDVIGAIELAASYGLKVLAKNPCLVKGTKRYLEHPNVVGAIVEKDCGTPGQMEYYRKEASKPELPTWFVSFGREGRTWVYDLADIIYEKKYAQMSCYFSTKGEYVNSIPVW